MAITRDQLEATLAVHDADALRLILHAADVDTRGAQTPAALAARIADAIWWNYCTPLGYLAERSTFEDIVRHLARKLGVSDRVDPDVSVWEQVSALTQALVTEIPAEGISIEALDENTRKRLFPAWGAPIGWGAGASSSFVTRWGSGRVLALLKTPIGRLLPLLPIVGPWVGAIRTGIGAVYLVTGPLGIALTVLSLNSALGSNYQRLVPLVLGIGALGPDPVFDAEIVKDRAQEHRADPAPEHTADRAVVSVTDIGPEGSDDAPLRAEPSEAHPQPEISPADATEIADDAPIFDAPTTAEEVLPAEQSTAAQGAAEASPSEEEISFEEENEPLSEDAPADPDGETTTAVTAAEPSRDPSEDPQDPSAS